MTLSNALVKILGFVAVLYFSRHIGGEQLGIYFLVQGLLLTLSMLADFGIRGSVEKRLSQGESKAEIVSTALVIKSILLLVTALSVYLFRGYVNTYLGEDLALLLIASLLTYESYTFVIYLLRGELRVGETAKLKLLQQILWFSLAVTMSFQNSTAVSLVQALVLSYLVVLLVGLSKTDIYVWEWSREAAESLWQYTRFNIINEASWQVFNWTDLLILGYFLGPVAVSSYEIGWRVTGVVLFMSSSVGNVIFPKISSLKPEGDENRIEEITQSSIVYSIYFPLPALFGVVILSEPILRLVFGSEYTIAALAMTVLAVQRLIQSVIVVFSKTIQAINLPALITKSQLVSITANVGLNLLLIPAFGITGAALATTSAYSIKLVMQVRYVYRHVGSPAPVREISWLTASAALMGGLLLLLPSPETVIELFGLITVGAVVYGLCSLRLPQFRNLVVEFLSIGASKLEQFH